MLYVAAEPVDATNLALFAQAAGADLKMPVEFSPPPAGAARRNLFLTDVKRNSAPFRAFGESLNAAIGPLRFGGGLASHPLAGGLPEDVLAEYGDSSACLVVTACAAGTLAILNADLNESNLVGSAVFVPLVDELVDKLLGRRMSDGCRRLRRVSRRLSARRRRCGGGIEDRRPGPGNAGPFGTISEDANFVMWRWNGIGPPGIYTVKRDTATVFAIAAAAPAQASDLTPLDLSLVKDRLAGDRSVSIQSASDNGERRDNLWAWVLVVCAGCMLMELMMLRVFRT